MTNKAKHTEGPWEVFTPESPEVIYEGGDNPHSIRSNDKSIAIVSQQGGGDSLANAKLISAAPELLEACKEAMLWAKTPQNHGGNPYGHKFIEIIVKAIQKAE